MTGKYLWFAIRINLLILGLSLLIAALSLFLIGPIIALLGLTQVLFLIVLIIPLWFAILLVIPLYFAFKWLYKKEAKKKKLKLKETIIWSIAIMIVVSFLLEYSTTEFIDPLMFAIQTIISVVLTSVVFYFAGRKYQPKH